LTLPEIAGKRSNEEILTDPLDRILVRDPRLKSCPASPMDEQSAEVDEDAIREYFAGLCQTVSGTPSHFVWNMNERGHQTWSDARDSISFVPSDLPHKKLYDSVPRTDKRITLIAFISVDGSYMRPTLAISRKTFEDELFLRGLPSEKVEIYSETEAIH
jgi:hypothetical protein